MRRTDWKTRRQARIWKSWRQLTGKHRKSLTTYLALIAADAQVDEKLLYPTAQEIQEQARAL